MFCPLKEGVSRCSDKYGPRKHHDQHTAPPPAQQQQQQQQHALLSRGTVNANPPLSRTVPIANKHKILSHFLLNKKARGHELAFRFAESAADVPLSSFGEREFDNLILLAQSLTGAVEKGGDGNAVAVADVMEFIEDGGEFFLCIFCIFFVAAVVGVFFMGTGCCCCCYCCDNRAVRLLGFPGVVSCTLYVEVCCTTAPKGR